MARGGARPGAGRPKGSRNKVDNHKRVLLAEKAREYTDSALQTLYQVATTGESESARVSAAVALLDRGHGKPIQAVEHSGDADAPFVVQLVQFGADGDD